ncbi:hypothetical protein ES705_04563 [subsurface metagenome]
MKRDFISIFDLGKQEIYEIFELTKKLKESQKKRHTTQNIKRQNPGNDL